MRDELGARAADWPLIVADSEDGAALAELAARTTAVATTVGPYRRYGMPLVEACAAAGTHYADLTGETLFMRETIERFDAPAKASGARIVHSCGFDSIPSDLGVARSCTRRPGELTETTLVVRRVRGGVSGGTLASLKGTVDDVQAGTARWRRSSAIRTRSRPTAPPSPSSATRADLRGAEYSEELGTWLGPFVMAPVNTRVVRRSNALQGWAYGRRFRYREVMGFGPGLTGRAKALGVGGGMAALTAGLALPPVAIRARPRAAGARRGAEGEARPEGLLRDRDPRAHRRPASAGSAAVEAQGDPGYGATR